MATSAYILSSSQFQEYRITDQILGMGEFGHVKLGIKDDVKVAIKIMNRLHPNFQDFSPDGFRREWEILSQLHHPRIVSFLGGYEKSPFTYTILEWMEGGALVDALNDFPDRFPLPTIKLIFRQLIDAVEYCHRNNIIHRDIKLDNILLRSTISSPSIVPVDNQSTQSEISKLSIESVDEQSHPSIEPIQIVLADFGFAISQSEDGPLLRDYPGSLVYAAPEMVRGYPYWGRPVDIWALGICLFALTYKVFPFYHPDSTKLSAQITLAELRPPFEVDTGLNELIVGMLDKSPKNRWTMTQIKSSKWLELN